jgi:N-acetyl-alpha-D-muramate 1-phosphate uridylyltransferase
MFNLALLAGGLATRMAPLTDRCPKSLLDVAGRPFILHQLDYFRNQGIERVVLCVGHLGEQICDVVGDGSAFGLEILYSSDGNHLLGTGGALNKALPLLGECFFVQYGDSFLPIDYKQVAQAFMQARQPALMTVLENAGRWDRSNVEFSGSKLAAYRKNTTNPNMRHIDYGLSVLSSELFIGRNSGDPFDLADLFQNLSLQGMLAGHEVSTRFYEIGSPKGLQDTINYFQT